ncbi:TrkH family potassium uptake protein [Methyloversatilis discipulorum]|jgi:trk system potassium uptake protein|uniref:TrkH family potassium uptake protein n=1 Tax=Methyloversatilis discipulorum TaxID=1119528 RepID=UPI0031380CE1
MLAVLNVLGRLLAVFSLTYLAPIVCSLMFHDGMLWHFIDSMAISAAGGVLLYMATRRHYRELKPRDGFLLVTLSWVLMSTIAAVPLMLSYDTMSFTDAFFETMSGLTTTGATVMTGLDHAPQSINLWRHLLNWIGGMGIIVFAVAILPLLGVGGMQLYKAETPGPMKDSKLTARITDTAKALYLVYVGMTAVCLLSLRLAGMDWFDAVCHSFSAMGLGGFSTRDASVGAFDSVLIELVLSFFMLLAGINFATHFLAVRRLSIGPYVRDAEARAYLTIMLLAFVGLTVFLLAEGVYDDVGTSARMVMFNLVSLGTGSGYASTDFAQWPIFAPLLMLFLGGLIPCAGSTGGGIKMVRTLVLFGQSQREILKLIHPAAVRPLMIGRTAVSEHVAQSVLGFIFLYFMSAALMVFALLLTGLDFITAFTAVIACINNIGPGLGEVGPAGNYQGLSGLQTWICSFAMLLGRLEVFAVLVIFTPGFWRK